jgi:hypothetical protein
MRQAVQALRYEHAGSAYHLTFSAAVSAVHDDEDATTLCERLHKLVDHVQQDEQGNHICVAEGDNATPWPRQEESAAAEVVTIE